MKRRVEKTAGIQGVKRSPKNIPPILSRKYAYNAGSPETATPIRKRRCRLIIKKARDKGVAFRGFRNEGFGVR